MDFTGRNCTVTPPGVAIEVVLTRDAVVEKDDRTEITAETGVLEGIKGKIPTPHHQDGQRQWGGSQNNREIGRLA